MQRKLVTRILSVVLSLILVTSAVFSLGHAKMARRDTQTPVQVICNPSTVVSGNRTQVIVYLSGTTSSPQVVSMSSSGPNFKKMNFKKMIVDGPANITVPAGSNNGAYMATITGNSGDQFTIIASCNGGEASGTVTVQ